jgi:hypothetical protein
VACWRRGSSAPVVLAADLLLGVGPRADVGAVKRGRQCAAHGQVALQDLRVHWRVLAAARQVPAALAALPRACAGSAHVVHRLCGALAGSTGLCSSATEHPVIPGCCLARRTRPLAGTPNDCAGHRCSHTKQLTELFQVNKRHGSTTQGTVSGGSAPKQASKVGPALA